MLPLHRPRVRPSSAALLLLASLLGGCREEARAPEPAFHHNESYGFMVGYPGTHTLIEHSPRFAEVGLGEGPRFEPRVWIVVESGHAENLEAFMRERALAACRRPTADSSVYCSELTRREPFTSLGSVEGERFYLRQLTVPRGGPAVEEERGPFYAFPLRDALAAGRFTLVLVRPPLLPGEPADDAELVDLVAATLRLTSAWVMR